jgi:6-phosphogluconolactonase
MTVNVSADHESLSQTVARRIRAVVTETLAEQDQFALALAGGSTPRRLYELLADADLPWSRIHLFWGDERVVPHDHPKSNVQLVRETLLTGISIPDDNVHPVPTEGSPDAAASAYADVLQHAFADRAHTFDLALLGMGTDGHTASLFPEHDPQPNDPKWVRAVSAPPRHDVAQRITCTLPVLNAARRAYVLVSGASKRETVDAALNERDDTLPITRVQPRQSLVWFLDEAATPPSTP